MGEKKSDKDTKINTEFISLSEASKACGYTPEYLNFLCRKKELQAKKIGRNWHTSREWLDEFIAKNEARKNESKKQELCLSMDHSRSIPTGINVDVQRKIDNIPAAGSADAQKIPPVLTRIESNDPVPGTRSSGPGFLFPKYLAGLSSMVIIIPLLLVTSYFVKNYSQHQLWKDDLPAIIGKIPSQAIVNENSEDTNDPVQGTVAGEDSSAAEEQAKKSGIILASENFKASNINFGSGIVLASNEESQSLEITDVKSESFITGKKGQAGTGQEEEVKLVVSWKTNKLAMSQLDLSKNNGQDPKTINEQSFGFNHAIVLTQVEPRTSYVYQIKGEDHWGNIVTSDFYGIFTASRPVSVFDLISNQINDIFGWAIKK